MKVGDYVRTENGIITRIRNIIDYEKPNEKKYLNYNEMCVLTNDWNNDVAGCRGEIIKSSPNIIDLIQVGDYVNGYLVKDIDYAFDDVVMNNKNARIVPYIDCNKNNYIDDIKSIVTKEQFESVEYMIKEK